MAQDLNSEPPRSKPASCQGRIWIWTWCRQIPSPNHWPLGYAASLLASVFSRLSSRHVAGVRERDVCVLAANIPHWWDKSMLTRKSFPAMGSNERRSYLQATGTVYLLINHRTSTRRSIFWYCKFSLDEMLVNHWVTNPGPQIRTSTSLRYGLAWRLPSSSKSGIIHLSTGSQVDVFESEWMTVENSWVASVLLFC